MLPKELWTLVDKFSIGLIQLVVCIYAEAHLSSF